MSYRQIWDRQRGEMVREFGRLAVEARRRVLVVIHDLAALPEAEQLELLCGFAELVTDARRGDTGR